MVKLLSLSTAIKFMEKIARHARAALHEYSDGMNKSRQSCSDLRINVQGFYLLANLKIGKS
jgi:hypothetical protein